ncbi:Ubiquitin carboxyl-terminal hydrolases family 2 [Ostreococcus tauri]|uniref:Ubiquitin carboxyl-terminal hydrolase n=2 Tax=Ostreococcus tauri TaxID=70448 RepID=A0A090N467_OSTTA|nr:Ubiquitin carboxyl-terminal hydrolases family 2 [Ostreococcus tauri]CEF99338.1 Ubiquitin carboxyl-terminal hydrolases family 2 [Ostreococcus tauri]|eukprot:XP_003081569.2 Ubiquitin carboxyl-terminal hydrolases family 2 [Ostreococcus tauri]
MRREGYGGRADAHGDSRRYKFGLPATTTTPEKCAIPLTSGRFKSLEGDSVETSADAPRDALDVWRDESDESIDRACLMVLRSEFGETGRRASEGDARNRGESAARERAERGAGSSIVSDRAREFTRGRARWRPDDEEIWRERKRRMTARRVDAPMIGACETGEHERALSQWQTVVSERARFRSRLRAMAGGIENLGNSCYISATLQMLKSLDGFVEDVNAIGWNDLARKPILAALARFFVQDEGKVLSAAEIKREMAKVGPYGDFDQQDAMEFLTVMLESIEREMGEDVERCPSRRNFAWRIAHTMKCGMCGDITTVDESMYALTLQVVAVSRHSIEQLLTNSFEPEMLERTCDRSGCFGRTCLSSRYVMSKPKVLLLHLKRFSASYDADTNEMQLHKIASNIRLPMNLTLPMNLNRVEAKKSPSNSRSEDQKINDGLSSDEILSGTPATHTPRVPVQTRSRVAEDNETFGLRSVVGHIGATLELGHYITHRRENGSNNWKTFDDERVTRYIAAIDRDDNSFFASSPQEFERECYVIAYDRTKNLG